MKICSNLLMVLEFPNKCLTIDMVHHNSHEFKMYSVKLELTN